MELLFAITASLGILAVTRFAIPRWKLKEIDQQIVLDERFCVIDIRDYISAHRSPFPGAENIPLSYLPRALKEQFDCQKEVLVVSDDIRGARIAANLFRKKRKKNIYYVTAA
ncbi:MULTISPECIES: rhodanese-like domain-containing protein [Thalassobacillus]|uniref:rhodanese-like domain-containing protein n=1 Tax=Thalassobacillus TaxID=331971 RepID=UPI000A1CF029|nr:rhodanese-like domain-containing protein [Thalassobacillus devorans]